MQSALGKIDLMALAGFVKKYHLFGSTVLVQGGGGGGTSAAAVVSAFGLWPVVAGGDVLSAIIV